LQAHGKAFLFFVFTEGYIKKYPCVDVHTPPCSSRTYVVPNNENISKLVKRDKNNISLNALELLIKSKLMIKHKKTPKQVKKAYKYDDSIQ